jgi:hypothetical protein
MLAREYKIVFEFFKENGARVGQVGAEIDWEPAREWTRFLGVRRGLLPLREPVRPTTIEPLWNHSKGEPYLHGFRVIVSGKDSGSVTEDFSISYFHRSARLSSSHFLEMGILKELEHFQYLVAAYPDHLGVHPEHDSPFKSLVIEPNMSYHGKSLSESMRGALREGIVCAGDMPVLVPQLVLDEAEAATLAARGTEVGGILIGHLSRDERLPEIFAEITAQIPARPNGDSVKLTFSSDTWTAVQAAVDIRNKKEIYLGFWHSHPVIEWCKNNNCSADKLQGCPVARGFLSADDKAVFRTVFPRAYSIALVCSDLPVGKPLFALFGWRRGMIESRGFHRFKT